MPVLYIITGSNGAGKSSVGPEYMPAHLKTSVFDGDRLFMNKRNEYWQSGIKSNKECKHLAADFVDRTFEDLVEHALDTGADFAYEGHFTTAATWTIPKRFKENGYEIHLIFFGLVDVSLSETRVIARAKEGGHNVDSFTLRNNSAVVGVRTNNHGTYSFSAFTKTSCCAHGLVVGVRTNNGAISNTYYL